MSRSCIDGIARSIAGAPELYGSDNEFWYREVGAVYSEMRAAASNGPYAIDFGGLTISVYPKVYSPFFFTDTLWFARELSELVEGASLLEIGTGTGFIAIACANNGARVTATDLNSEAVRNARVNIERHNRAIQVYEGYLYEPLPKGSKFDFIFWAHPFNKWDKPVDDQLLLSGLDYEYRGLRGYIAGARNYLGQAGRLLLGTGSGADLASIEDIATEYGYRLSVIKKESLPLAYCSALQTGYLLCELIEG